MNTARTLHLFPRFGRVIKIMVRAFGWHWIVWKGFFRRGKIFDVSNCLFMNKKVKMVVTGGSGFIGQALIKNLVQKKIDVISVSKTKQSHASVPSLVCDVATPKALDRYVDSNTVIFHLAAKADVRESVRDPIDTFNNNCPGLLEILETSKRTGAKVIYTSTASIFDPSNSLPVAENAFVRPTSPYGAAKAAGEAFCFAYNRCYGVDVRIARLFSVYGEGMSRFAIYDIINKIKKDDAEIKLASDGSQVRDYLYIDDVVAGLQIIANKGAPGEDYNVAFGKGISVIDLARRISQLMDRPNLVIRTSKTAMSGDVQQWYGNISKIEKLGFSPSVQLDVGLKKTIRWLDRGK